jgi:DNA-binding CsgD family transcriptional regulator
MARNERVGKELGPKSHLTPRDLLELQHREIDKLWRVCQQILNALAFASESDRIRLESRAKLFAAIVVEGRKRMDLALRDGEHWLAGPPMEVPRIDGSGAMCSSACAGLNVLLEGLGLCLAGSVSADLAASEALLRDSALLSSKLAEKWATEGVPEELDSVLPWAWWCFDFVRTEIHAARTRCTAEFRQSWNAASASVAAKRRRSRRQAESGALTDKQLEVIHMMGEYGGDTAAVAKRLGKDRKTVDQHYKAGMRKLSIEAPNEKKLGSLPSGLRGDDEVTTDDDRRARIRPRDRRRV